MGTARETPGLSVTEGQDLNRRPLRPERGRALLPAVGLCRQVPPELRFPAVLSWEVPGDGEPFAPGSLRRHAGSQRHPVDLAAPNHAGAGGQHASMTVTDHARLARRPRRDSPPGGRWDGALPPPPRYRCRCAVRAIPETCPPARAALMRWVSPPPGSVKSALSWPSGGSSWRLSVAIWLHSL